MSTLTPNYGLTKPANGENYSVTIVNANNDILDTELKAVDTAYKAADTALDTRVDTLEAEFSNPGLTVITDLFVAAANWTINEQKAYVWGPVIFIYINVSRTTSTLSSNTDGNIGNVSIATWDTGKDAYKPTGGTEAGFAGAEGGPLWGGFISASSIAVNALQGGIDLSIGGNLRGTTMYFRDI